MYKISKEVFNTLAKIRDVNAVSIFLPTHQAGMEVNNHLDRKMLNNLLYEAKNHLVKYQLSENEITNYLSPIYTLLEKSSLWRNLANGLAFFLTKNNFEYYILPYSFDPFVYVGEHLYLSPIVPLLENENIFYILEFSLQNVRFFKADKFQINEIQLKKSIPKKLEDVVGSDFKQKFLQFRDAHNLGVSFHGHGEGKDEKKTEIKDYLNVLDKSLFQNYLKNEKSPLILAAVDYLVPIYKKITNYSNIYNKHIKGNCKHISSTDIHKKAILLLKDYWEKLKTEKVKQYYFFLNSKKSSNKINEIISAAHYGRVDTLFSVKNTNVWGIFDYENNKTKIDRKKKPGNCCLINLAIIETVLNNGKVYLLNPEEMLHKNAPLEAIFRY